MAESLPDSTPAHKDSHERPIPTDPADKREFPRFKIEGATSSVGKPGLLDSLGLGPIRHAVVNLSQGGAMIRLGKLLPVGSLHELHLEIPKCKELIETVGEVRWCLASDKDERD